MAAAAAAATAASHCPVSLSVLPLGLQLRGRHDVGDVPHLVHPLEPRLEPELVLRSERLPAEAAALDQAEEVQDDPVAVAVVVLAADDDAERFLQQLKDLSEA